MKRRKCLMALIVSLFIGSSAVYAEKQKAEHLLDGTSMEYTYQNGAGISIEFYEGQLKFEWISGPAKGNSGQDIPYRSRKIGDEMYIVNFQQKDKANFVTLVFNFKQNVMCGSNLLRYGTDKEKVGFHGGIIEHVKR